MGVGRRKVGKILHFPVDVLVKKCFYISFELVKSNFTIADPPWPPLGKIHYWTPWKNPSHVHGMKSMDPFQQRCSRLWTSQL